jgi:hypothetical protein
MLIWYVIPLWWDTHIYCMLLLRRNYDLALRICGQVTLVCCKIVPYDGIMILYVVHWWGSSCRFIAYFVCLLRLWSCTLCIHRVLRSFIKKFCLQRYNFAMVIDGFYCVWYFCAQHNFNPTYHSYSDELVFCFKVTNMPKPTPLYNHSSRAATVIC